MQVQPEENICHMGRRVDYQGPSHLSPSRVSDVKNAIEDALTPAGNQAGASDMATGTGPQGLTTETIPDHRSVSGSVNQLVETQAHNYEGQVLENDTNNAATDGSRPPITPLPNDPSGSLETKKKNDRTRFKERKI